MTFRVRSFVEIAGNMMGHARATQRRVTDFTVGSVARVMFEAPASEIDQLYQEMAQGLIEGIPTAIYRSFDFELQAARSASGVLRFTARPDRDEPVKIPVGFLVSTATGQRFQTAESGVIPVGQTALELLAAAMEPGGAGNVAAGLVTRAVGSALGLLGVTNPQAFDNGRGKETEGERKLRFVEFVRTLARGTPAALAYAARELAFIPDPRTGQPIERVARATPEETTGHYRIHIHNGAGNTSAALVAKAQTVIDGWYDVATGLPVPGYAPAGMRVVVLPMREIEVDAVLHAEVPLTRRSDALKRKIELAAVAAIRSTPSGGRLRPLDLRNAAMALDEVPGATVEEPTLTVACPLDAVLVPGSVQVLWL